MKFHFSEQPGADHLWVTFADGDKVGNVAMPRWLHERFQAGAAWSWQEDGRMILSKEGRAPVLDEVERRALEMVANVVVPKRAEPELNLETNINKALALLDLLEESYCAFQSEHRGRRGQHIGAGLMNITGGLVEEIVEGFNALHAECRLWRDRTLALRKLDGLPPEPGYEHCLDHSDELKFARVMARQRMTTDTSAAKEGQVAA